MKQRIIIVAELMRNEWLFYRSNIERPSKDGCQEQALNQIPTNSILRRELQKQETAVVVND